MVELGGVESGVTTLRRDTLSVRGPDRKTWLDGLLTCAVTAVSERVAGYGLLLTKQGKIVTDAFLADTGQELLVGVAPGQGASVRALLDRYLVMEDAELDAPSAPLVWCLGAAPGSADGVVARGALALGTWQTELFVTTTAPAVFADASDLLAAQGFGTFGVDFGERDNPHEASLDRVAVSWTKGCYLGQEVVCMQDMRGKVKRRLVALDGSDALLRAAASKQPLEVISADGSVAGLVSSVHAGPQGARLLASISTSALESQAALSLLGEPLRVAFGAPPKLG